MTDDDASMTAEATMARAKKLNSEAGRLDAAGEHDACRDVARELISLAEGSDLPLHLLYNGVHFVATSDEAQGRLSDARRGYERVDRVMGGASWREIEPDRTANDRVFHARTLFRIANVSLQERDVDAGITAMKRSIGLLHEMIEEDEANRAHAGLPLAAFAAHLAHVQTQVSPQVATAFMIYTGQDPTDDPDFEDPRPAFHLAIQTAVRQIDAGLEGVDFLEERIVAWGNQAGKYCSEVGWLEDGSWFLKRAHEYAVPRYARTRTTDDMHALARTESYSGSLSAKRGQYHAAADWFGRVIDRIEAWGAESGANVEHDLEIWREARSQALASA